MKSKTIKILSNLSPIFALFAGLSIGQTVRIIRGTEDGNLILWSILGTIGLIYTILYIRHIIKN